MEIAPLGLCSDSPTVKTVGSRSLAPGDANAAPRFTTGDAKTASQSPLSHLPYSPLAAESSPTPMSACSWGHQSSWEEAERVASIDSAQRSITLEAYARRAA
jgi:hypothetical protein